MTAATCPKTGKIAHPSRADALTHLRALLRGGGSVDLNVYRCGSHWHVGHSWYSLRRRIRKAKRAGIA